MDSGTGNIDRSISNTIDLPTMTILLLVTQVGTSINKVIVKNNRIRCSDESHSVRCQTTNDKAKKLNVYRFMFPID